MKRGDRPLTTRDGELREDLTHAELATFAPAANVLPLHVQEKLGMRVRGPQKTPTKIPTSIRLSPNVIDAFKATGRGWQSRIDDALQTYLVEHPTPGHRG